MIEIREYIDDRGDIISDELVDVAKEYDMLAKLKLINEKDMAAFRSELVGSDNNEDIDEDSRFIRELSIASGTNASDRDFSTLVEELDKFEVFERDFIEQEAAPKDTEVTKSEEISSISNSSSSSISSSIAGTKSSGWKGGFLLPSSESKIRKQKSVKARVEDNTQPPSTSTSLASQERNQVLSASQEIVEDKKQEEEEVTVKKEVKKAFSGNIIERF
eukprot:gene23061-31379_t